MGTTPSKGVRCHTSSGNLEEDKVSGPGKRGLGAKEIAIGASEVQLHLNPSEAEAVMRGGPNRSRADRCSSVP